VASSGRRLEDDVVGPRPQVARCRDGYTVSEDAQPEDGSGDDHVYQRIQTLLLTVTDIEGFLRELTGLAAELTDGAAACGITLRYDHHLLTVGSSDPRVEVLDETQYRSRTGPCLEAMATGRVVDSPDTRAEERWPEYTEVAREAGLRCSLGLPLTLDGDTFGAMNLYGFEQAEAFGRAERRRAEVLAGHAAGTLRLASRQVRDAELMEQMERALRSRTTIDQAMGIIMAQQGCGADQAFALLRAQSQASGTRLRDVAALLVAQVSGEAPRPGRAFDAD
jgi:hypothetical protein